MERIAFAVLENGHVGGLVRLAFFEDPDGNQPYLNELKTEYGKYAPRSAAA